MCEMELEEWRPIPGFEGYYSASNLGRIRRDAAGKGTHAGHPRKPMSGKRGYQYVALSVNGRVFQHTVHSLVALSYSGPRPPGYTINHKDGRKDNNAAANLEYVTDAENKEHASQHGLLMHGARHTHTHMTDVLVRACRADYASGAYSLSMLAKKYPLTASGIHALVRRRTWKHVI